MSALPSAHPVASASATLRLATLAYSKQEAAEVIGCSYRHLSRLIRTGQLVAKKSGAKVLILAADLQRFLEQLPPA